MNIWVSCYMVMQTEGFCESRHSGAGGMQPFPLLTDSRLCEHDEARMIRAACNMTGDRNCRGLIRAVSRAHRLYRCRSQHVAG